MLKKDIAKWVEDKHVPHVQVVDKWPYARVAPQVQRGDGGMWLWTIGAAYGVHEVDDEGAAKRAALDAALDEVDHDTRAVFALKGVMMLRGAK